MGKYIIKRILLLIPILIGATFLVFAIMEISPGDPALTILGADANEEAIARIHEELGLDRPFIVRYHAIKPETKAKALLQCYRPGSVLSALS